MSADDLEKRLLEVYQKQLNHPVIKSLNLTPAEVKKWFSLINDIYLQEVGCLNLSDHTKCINSNKKHLRLIRTEDNRIKPILIDCPNLVNKSNLIDQYQENKEPIGLNLLLVEQNNSNRTIQSNKASFISDVLLKTIQKISQKSSCKNICGLYVYGDNGVGKSLLMHEFILELQKLKLNLKTAFVFVPKILRSLKDSFDNENENYVKSMIDLLSGVDVLVLDDIGAESTSEWFYNEFLLNILNVRMYENRMTWFTSNLSLDELERHIKTKAKMDRVTINRFMSRIRTLVQNNEIKLIDKNNRY